MSVFLQSVLAVFAAEGFYTVLHTVYEIVSARLLRLHGSGGADAVWRRLRCRQRTPDPRGTARAAAVFSLVADYICRNRQRTRDRTSPSTWRHGRT